MKVQKLPMPVINIDLQSNESFDGNAVIISAETDTETGDGHPKQNLIVMTGYKTEAFDFYVADGRDSPGPLVKIGPGRFQSLSNIAVVNGGDGGGVFLHNQDDSEAGFGEGCNRTHINRVDIEDFTTTGIDIQPSVTETRVDNVHLSGKVDYTDGLGKPRVGSIGWQQDTPVTNDLAVGGHQITNMNCIGCQYGMVLNDAQLSKFSNCIADSCSNYGLKITGASANIEFADLFVGTTMGVYVGGTSNISFNGLRTVSNGSVPPWGKTDFYDTSGDIYDITVADTATVVVRGWRGDKKISVADGATLIIEDGTVFQGRSIGAVAANTSTYLCNFGNTSTIDDAQWRAPYDGYIVRLCPTPTAAPGGSMPAETFTYQAVVGGVVSTDLEAVLTGADVGGKDFWADGSGIFVAKGGSICLKLTTSSSAAAARHYCEMQFVSAE